MKAALLQEVACHLPDLQTLGGWARVGRGGGGQERDGEVGGSACVCEGWGAERFVPLWHQG